MAIKALSNKKKTITKRLPHLTKELTVKEKKIRSTVKSLCKNLPRHGLVTLRSSVTFIEYVTSKQKENFMKRKNKAVDTVEITPCTSPSNSSYLCEGTTPTSQDSNAFFSLGQHDIMEETEEDMMEEYMSCNAGEVEDLDGMIAEVDHSHQEEETLTTIKEFIFDEDGTKVIFHFNKTNKWTIEIIEDNEKNLPPIYSLPKKQGIPIPSLYLKAALPEVNIKQGKDYVKRLVSNDIQRAKSVLPEIPEKVSVKKSREYVKRVVSSDIERVKKSCSVVLEFLVSIDSSIKLSSTLTDGSFSQGLAGTYWYIRIVR